MNNSPSKKQPSAHAEGLEILEAEPNLWNLDGTGYQPGQVIPIPGHTSIEIKASPRFIKPRLYLDGVPVRDGAIITGLNPGMHPIECTYTDEGDVPGDLTGTLNVGTGTEDDSREARMSTPSSKRPLGIQADYLIELRGKDWYLNGTAATEKKMRVPAVSNQSLMFSITPETIPPREDDPARIHIARSGVTSFIQAPIRLNTPLPDVLPSGEYLLTVYTADKTLLGDITGTLNVGRGGDEPPSSVSARAPGMDDSSQDP